MKHISRRDFLKGAAAGAAGLAAAGILGACSSDTSVTEGTTAALASTAAQTAGTMAAETQAAETQPAETQALTAPAGAGSHMSWMTPPEEATEFEAEYETDVVICGHGYAGICSCRELAEQGVKTILIEKRPEENYMAVGNEFGALNASILKERGVPYIDPVEFYQNWMLNSQNYANQELIMKFAQNSGETTDWYLSELTKEDLDTMTTAYFPEAEGQMRQVGMLKFWPSVCSFYGACNQTRIQGLNRQVAIDHGAQVLFGTSAHYLIMENGAVAGVVAQAHGMLAN